MSPSSGEEIEASQASVLPLPTASECQDLDTTPSNISQTSSVKDTPNDANVLNLDIDITLDSVQSGGMKERPSTEPPNTATNASTKRKSGPDQIVETTVMKKQRSYSEPADASMPSARLIGLNDPTITQKEIQALHKRLDEGLNSVNKRLLKLERVEEQSSEVKDAELGKTTAELEDMVENLQAANSELEKKAKQAEDDKTKALRLAQKSSKKAEEIKRLQTTLVEAHKADQKLRGQEAEDTVRELRDQNEQLLEENQMQVQIINGLQRDIQKYGNERADKDMDYEKVCDSAIKGGWENMMHLVGQTVAVCMKHRPSGKPVLKTSGRSFESTLSLARRLEDSTPGFQIAQIQGSLWRRIVLGIFKSDQQLWGGAAGSMVIPLCRNLEDVGFADIENAAAFSSIKSANAHHLDEIFGTDKEAMEKYINDLTRDYDIFVTREEGGGKKRQLFRTYISKVVHQAHKLRVTMMKSKALFQISWPQLKGCKGVEFPGEDEVEIGFTQWTPGKAEREVLGVITPALLKCGLADGYGFENHTTLVKPLVVVAEPRSEKDMRLLDTMSRRPGSGTAGPAANDKRQRHKKASKVEWKDDEMGDSGTGVSQETDGSNWSTN